MVPVLSASARVLLRPLTRVLGLLGQEDRWLTVTVGSMLAGAAAGLWWLLGHAAEFSLLGHLPLATTAALTYTALTALVVVRRRIGRRSGVVVVAGLLSLMVAEGMTYPDPNLQWICLVFLTVLPLLAVVLLGRLGAVLTTVGCLAAVLLVASRLPGTPLVHTYVSSTMATLVVVPVVVVGVLVNQLQRARREATTAAQTDPLTGLLNRRGVMARLDDLVTTAASRGERVAVTLLDLDHFKRINDEQGHIVGDQVLVRVAQILGASVRSGDLLVRLGGEEIAWLARHGGAAEAAEVAERARLAVARESGGSLPPVTASLGVAVSVPLPDRGAPDALRLLDVLLASADKALYRAKDAGRDRVETSPEVALPPPSPQSPDRAPAERTDGARGPQTERASSTASPV